MGHTAYEAYLWVWVTPGIILGLLEVRGTSRRAPQRGKRQEGRETKRKRRGVRMGRGKSYHPLHYQQDLILGQK